MLCATNPTSNIGQGAQCQPEGTSEGLLHLSVQFMVSWETMFDVLHVIYGKAQAAELVTSRSSSFSCYYTLQSQPGTREPLAPLRAVVPQLACPTGP